MQIKEIIQRFQSAYSRGVNSDDTRLSPRHIYNKMLTLRSKLLSLEAKKKQKINQWNYQTIPCVEMVLASLSECPCIPQVGCNILRSKYKLPKPLTNLGEHLIQSVTTLDGNTVFSETTWVAKKYNSANKYTSSKPDFYIRDEYLYITIKGHSHLAVVAITGLFEDPLKVQNYPSFCESECKDCKNCDSPLDKEFPIDNDMLDTLIEMGFQELLNYFQQAAKDNTNNSRDDRQDQTGETQEQQR